MEHAAGTETVVPPTPDPLRTALHRRFLAATVGRFGPVVTQHPEQAADVAMAVVSPVLESCDRQKAALAARVAELEALAQELIGEWKPYPRPDSTDYYRSPVPVPASALARWRAVLER